MGLCREGLCLGLEVSQRRHLCTSSKGHPNTDLDTFGATVECSGSLPTTECLEMLQKMQQQQPF